MDIHIPQLEGFFSSEWKQSLNNKRRLWWVIKDLMVGTATVHMKHEFFVGIGKCTAEFVFEQFEFFGIQSRA